MCHIACSGEVRLSRTRSASEACLDDIPDDATKVKILQSFTKKEDFESMQEVVKQMQVQMASTQNMLNLSMANATKLQASKDQLQIERRSIFIDAVKLYQRGIVELLLNGFASLHVQDQENGVTKFCCNGFWHDLSFGKLMDHWEKCSLHENLPIIKTQFYDSKFQLYAKPATVSNALKYLYSTLSSSIHFKTEFPVTIFRLENDYDSLALVTFLEFYQIPFQFNLNPPVSVDPTSAPCSL